MSDFLEQLDEIVPDNNFNDSSEKSQDKDEVMDTHLTTFKNIRQVLFDEVEKIKRDAYDRAYQEYMLEHENAEDKTARAYAEKARKKATPNTPLAVAIILKNIFTLSELNQKHKTKKRRYTSTNLIMVSMLKIMSFCKI